MTDTGDLQPTEVEQQIEQAQVAGDDALAQRLYLRQQGADTGEPGDTGEQGDDVGPAEATEPSDIGPVPDGDWTFDRPEVVDHQFAIMKSEFGELATDLRSDWGVDAGRNLEFALATVKQFESHYPELIQTVEARGARNDPLVVELLAVLGRQWASTPGDPTTVKLFPGTGDNEQERTMEIEADFDEKTDELMTQQEQAQVEGNLGKVNRLEREIRARFVKRYGTGAAIGSSGGPTA